MQNQMFSSHQEVKNLLGKKDAEKYTNHFTGIVESLKIQYGDKARSIVSPDHVLKASGLAEKVIKKHTRVNLIPRAKQAIIDLLTGMLMKQIQWLMLASGNKNRASIVFYRDENGIWCDKVTIGTSRNVPARAETIRFMLEGETEEQKPRKSSRKRK